MNPNLDELIEKEKAAFENLSEAFIQHSVARNNVQNALREIREGLPNLFTNEIDLNEVAYLPLDPDMPGFTPPRLTGFIDKKDT